MARSIHSDVAFKKLSGLLLDAAGIPEDKRMFVTAITCRCAASEVVRFTIEKCGEQDDILKAIESLKYNGPKRIDGTGLEISK